MHLQSLDAAAPPALQPGRSRGRRAGFAMAAAAVGAVGITIAVSAATWSTTDAHADHRTTPTMPAADERAAMVATARYQDVAVAEADGWSSTLDSLGCFEDATRGGMGVHYVNDDVMDRVVDVAAPEALVYELDEDGAIVGLVAHEYIVPVDAWTSPEPPRLFDMDFHRHPVLPLWVLHAWLWKPNTAGMFADWNPAVRPCPSGVPIFGVDRPR
jgi:hypothetical protein